MTDHIHYPKMLYRGEDETKVVDNEQDHKAAEALGYVTLDKHDKGQGKHAPTAKQLASTAKADKDADDAKELQRIQADLLTQAERDRDEAVEALKREQVAHEDTKARVEQMLSTVGELEAEKKEHTETRSKLSAAQMEISKLTDELAKFDHNNDGKAGGSKPKSAG